jgi:hypothetical protein
MLTFLHCAQDPFTNTQRNADLLTLADRKVGQKNLHIVEFIGTPPPPGTGIGMWAMLVIQGGNLKRRRLIDLVIDADEFSGTLGFVLPPPLFPEDPPGQAKKFKLQSNDIVKRWRENHTVVAERLFHEAKYPVVQFNLLLAAMKAVANQRPLAMRGGQRAAIRGLPLTPAGEHVIFIRIDLPRGTKIGASSSFDVTMQDSKTHDVLGGSRYVTVVNRQRG